MVSREATFDDKDERIEEAPQETTLDQGRSRVRCSDKVHQIYCGSSSPKSRNLHASGTITPRKNRTKKAKDDVQSAPYGVRCC